MKIIFEKQFGAVDNLREFIAPGRINIIGEHVDYLGGIVLPAAINLFIHAGIRFNQKKSYRLYSIDYGSYLELESIEKSNRFLWANYILGVIEQFQEKGFSIPSFDFAFTGTIPPGSGLSSSAALEMVCAYAINETLGLGLNRTELALLSQKAEHSFVGTKCGIMDQFAVAYGKEGYCISLHTQTLDYQYHAFDLKDHEFSLIQSNVHHSLVSSEYNQRRLECESALQKIQKARLERNLSRIQNLYDLDWNLDVRDYGLNEIEVKRVRHVQTEKERTSRVIDGLIHGNFTKVGEALTECHWSLSLDYEVSCKETDFIVEYLTDAGAKGARMMGGGFGGCVLVLAKKGWIDSVFPKLNDEYQKQFQIQANLIHFQTADGVKERIG